MPQRIDLTEKLPAHHIPDGLPDYILLSQDSHYPEICRRRRGRSEYFVGDEKGGIN